MSFGPTHFAPMLAEMARRHPLLQMQTCYSDRFVDLIGEGYDCAIRVGYLPDSNLIARGIGPIFTKLVASPGYIKAHGEPAGPHDLLAHEALMQGTETWQFMDGGNVVTVRPQGRFKADNGTALVAAATAGLGVAYLPDCLTYEQVKSGALVPIMTRYPRRRQAPMSCAPGATSGAQDPGPHRTADRVVRTVTPFRQAGIRVNGFAKKHYCRNNTAAASRMKISTVFGPIPSNSQRRFSNAL
ncbi:substrate binding domain-containing protein [Pseudomonas sp. A4]|nr:substrate binding domain-containing protein [Pseudomonas sp. S11A4]MCR8931573.1 substrate binding domain-containing protein [Pseudomonas sp. S11A4]